MPQRSSQTILASLKEIQPSLREEFGVSELWVFGSYVRGEQKSSSDVDVMVEFDRPGMTLLRFVDLEMRLSEHLGVKVDLLQRAVLRPRIRPTVLAEAVAI